jgi:hypothetical protein
LDKRGLDKRGQIYFPENKSVPFFLILKKWSIHHGYGSVEMRKPRIFLASSVEGLGVAFDLA